MKNQMLFPKLISVLFALSFQMSCSIKERAVLDKVSNLFLSDKCMYSDEVDSVYIFENYDTIFLVHKVELQCAELKLRAMNKNVVCVFSPKTDFHPTMISRDRNVKNNSVYLFEFRYKNKVAYVDFYVPKLNIEMFITYRKKGSHFVIENYKGFQY